MVANCVELILSAMVVLNVDLVARLDVGAFLLKVGNIGGSWSGVDHIVFDIEIQRESNVGFVLLFPDDPLALKSLQMQNQNFRCLINCNFLCCQLVILAVGTIPFIARLQLLLLLEHAKALLK